MAHMVSAHGNLRVEDFFNPHNGRLTESSESNITAAKAGTLEISIPWLDPRYQQHSGDHEKSCHPVTRSNNRFCLFDKLHQSNTKKREEILRHIDLVPQLRFQLNSQAQEQLFSLLKRNSYFLNMMGPGTHLLVNRLIINDHNVEKNNKFRSDIEKRVRCKTTLSDLGKIVSNERKGNSTFTPAPPAPNKPSTHKSVPVPDDSIPGKYNYLSVKV